MALHSNSIMLNFISNAAVVTSQVQALTSALTSATAAATNLNSQTAQAGGGGGGGSSTPAIPPNAIVPGPYNPGTISRFFDDLGAGAESMIKSFFGLSAIISSTILVLKSLNDHMYKITDTQDEYAEKVISFLTIRDEAELHKWEKFSMGYGMKPSQAIPQIQKILSMQHIKGNELEAVKEYFNMSKLGVADDDAIAILRLAEQGRSPREVTAGLLAAGQNSMLSPTELAKQSRGVGLFNDPALGFAMLETLSQSGSIRPEQLGTAQNQVAQLMFNNNNRMMKRVERSYDTQAFGEQGVGFTRWADIGAMEKLEYMSTEILDTSPEGLMRAGAGRVQQARSLSVLLKNMAYLREAIKKQEIAMAMGANGGPSYSDAMRADVYDSDILLLNLESSRMASSKKEYMDIRSDNGSSINSARTGWAMPGGIGALEKRLGTWGLDENGKRGFWRTIVHGLDRMSFGGGPGYYGGDEYDPNWRGGDDVNLKTGLKQTPEFNRYKGMNDTRYPRASTENILENTDTINERDARRNAEEVAMKRIMQDEEAVALLQEISATLLNIANGTYPVVYTEG